MTLRNLNSGKKAMLRIAALGLASLSLSGCVYDLGLGYYDNGYSNYDCDPYSPWDSYYNCDTGYGYSNIGYGGGWYDNFYYPGYGIYVFDSYGSRYNMRDNYRRYWSNQRYDWQRSRGGQGHHGQGRNYYEGATNQPRGWPEQHGGRNDDHRDRGRHSDNQGWGNNQGGVRAVPPPQQRQDRVRPDYPRNEEYGRGDRGPRAGQPRMEQNTGAVAQPVPPAQDQGNRGYGRRGYGRGGDGGGQGGGGYSPVPQSAAPAPAPQAAPQPRYVPQDEPRQEPQNEPRQERPRNERFDPE